MARKVRLEFPGAIYDVMNREDRGEEVVSDGQSPGAPGASALLVGPEEREEKAH
jgi:hypothetical protein